MNNDTCISGGLISAFVMPRVEAWWTHRYRKRLVEDSFTESMRNRLIELDPNLAAVLEVLIVRIDRAVERPAPFPTAVSFFLGVVSGLIVLFITVW